MTNLWSHCGNAYEDQWPQLPYCENGQGSLGGPWWEKWDAYLRNSPLYNAASIHTPLLLVHGDQDGAVRFLQSVELFNTLRRMGDKPVVLLEYKGEGHSFNRDAERDLILRLMPEFFDHFLRGKPAPRWWADEVSYYEGETSQQ